MKQPPLQADRAACRSGGSDSRTHPCVFAHGIQQGLEGVSKELDAVDHQFVRHFLHRYASFCKIGHGLPSAIDVFREAGSQFSVVAEGIKSSRGNGVDGILANQFFDVKHIAILWILGAGAGPELALRLRALGCECLPPRAAEKFLILLVGEAGVGDSHLASNALQQSSLARVRASLEPLIYLAVNERVDAADEKAGHTRDVADVLALCRASFQCGKECFGNLFVRGLREKESDIDVDAVFESLSYCGTAFGCARDLDHDVRAIHGLPEAAGFRERGDVIETEKLRNFLADVTVARLPFRLDGL